MKFTPGVSGNLKGRPTNAELAKRATPNAKLRSLLKKLERSLPEAVDKMVELMNNENTPSTVQMTAAKTILSEYKEIYQMLEAPAKKKVDEDDDVPVVTIPEIDFSNIVSV